MPKWPVHKQTHRTTQKHVEHQDATDIQKNILDCHNCNVHEIKIRKHFDMST